jgi:hypothetical protein
MANWRWTRIPGIYVAHSKGCPAYADADARCRCKPSWRGRRRDPVSGKPVWQKATKDRGEVLAWLGAVSAGADHLAKLADRGPTFESLGDEWLDGVERGHIGRRRGRGKPYSGTTVEAMRRSWRYHLRPEFGPRFAGELTEVEWQRWVDEACAQGPIALDDRQARGCRLGHLRMGVGTEPQADEAQPAPRRRAPAERRETEDAGGARTGGRGAPRRARAGRSGADDAAERLNAYLLRSRQ